MNNGIKGYLNENVEYLNEGNTISFGQDTATMFYQKDSYFTGDKIKIMKAKFPEFNAALAMYFIATMGRAFSNFSWGSSSFSVEIIKKQIITLPTLNDKLAFSYMEEVIKALETERIETLEAYLTVTGLKDYQLSKKDEEILDTFTGLTTLESRAEQSRAEQSRAEQSRAEQSRAEQSRAEQSRAEQSRAEQSRAEQSRAEQSRAEQSRAEQSRAEQSRAA